MQTLARAVVRLRRRHPQLMGTRRQRDLLASRLTIKRRLERLRHQVKVRRSRLGIELDCRHRRERVLASDIHQNVVTDV